MKVRILHILQDKPWTHFDIGAMFTGEKDAAAACTVHPIPPACGVYYFEVEILGKEQKA